MIVEMKGIGISLVDFNPEEICYISLDEIYLNKFTVTNQNLMI